MARDVGKAPPSSTAARGTRESSDGLTYLEPVRAQAFLGLVRAGDALARVLDATLQREHGLSLHAFEVLLFLAVFADDREKPMSELRDKTPLSQSRVSRLVAELEAQGLVVRSTNSSDTRAVNVRITDEGVATFAAAQHRHLNDLDEELFSKLTDREIHQLATITAKILQPPTKAEVPRPARYPSEPGDGPKAR